MLNSDAIAFAEYERYLFYGRSLLKVSHTWGSPRSSPRLNQPTRCDELPWVKASGTT